MSAGLYGNLTLLHDKMHYYWAEEDENLVAEYKKSIIDIYADLNFEHEFNVSADDLREMNTTEFDNFILYGPVHDYLHEIASEYMPYGLHILGEQMDDEGITAMVKSMLGENFGGHIAAANLCEDPHYLDPAHSPNLLDELLDDVLVDGADPMDMLLDRFDITYSSGEFIANTTCDVSGEYDFSMVKDGKYTLYALKQADDGWLTGNEYITIEGGQALSSVRLNLSKNVTGTINTELEYAIELLGDNPPVSKPAGTCTIFGDITYSPMGPLWDVPNATVVVRKDDTILGVDMTQQAIIHSQTCLTGTML